MMQRLSNSLNLTGMAMLFLPIIMVKILATAIGISSPSEVGAFTGARIPVTIPISVFDSQTWPEQQRLAIAYVDELQQHPFDQNPLLYGASSERQSTKIGSPALTYTLQMIMATNSGTIALINDQQYIVGDLLNGGLWEITAISKDNRQVILRHQDTGRESVLDVN